MKLETQVAGAQEAGPIAVPGEGRHHQHLSRIARPHHQQQGVLAHEILPRGVERGEAQPGEHEKRQRAGERMGDRGVAGHDAIATEISTRRSSPGWRGAVADGESASLIRP